MIDINLQQHFAVQHSHNTAGDFIRKFGGTTFGEIPVNPSWEGVTFFRPQSIHDPETQIKAFKVVHTVLRDVGGLNGVILFGNVMHGNIKSAVTIAKGIKEYDPAIQTILLNSQLDYTLNNSSVFNTPVNQNLAGILFDKQIEFTATSQRTVFSARFETNNGLARRLNLCKHFTPASHFDAVVTVGQRCWKTAVMELTGISGLRDGELMGNQNSWNFDARDQYFSTFPALEEVERMVCASNGPDAWKKFLGTLSL